MKSDGIDLDRIQSILQKHHHERWGLIPMLQEIQETYSYIALLGDISADD